MEKIDSSKVDFNHLEQYDLLELIRARESEASEKIDEFIMQKYGKEGLLEEESKSHDPDLQCYLGLLASNEKNMEKSWEWYEKSACQGNASAQYIIGEHYRARFGWTHKDEDINKAIGWLEKAYDALGDVLSLSCLVYSYQDRDDEGDFEKAVELYEKAVERHDEWSSEAMARLSSLYQDKLEELEDDCEEDSDEYKELKNKMFDWLKKTADSGDSRSQRSLAIMYEYGKEGCEQDYFKAFNYYKKAAEQIEHVEEAEAFEQAVAYFDLGRCYRDGIGCEKDKVKAVEWFKKAAALGSNKANKALKELGETVSYD